MIRIISHISEVEQDLLGVLDALLDLSQEEHGLSAVNDAVIVGQSHVHDGTGQDLATDDDGSHLGGVHAKDSALRRVDDRGAHHGAENATIGDGESATGHVLNGDLAFASLLGEVSQALLQVVEAHILAVSDNGNDKASRGGHSS